MNWLAHSTEFDFGPYVGPRSTFEALSVHVFEIPLESCVLIWKWKSI